jgi:hypothetical protein
VIAVVVVSKKILQMPFLIIFLLQVFRKKLFLFEGEKKSNHATEGKK